MKHQPFALLIISLVLISGCSSDTNNKNSSDRISPEMATTLRKAMVKDLTGSETSKTNDIQKYCDCVVDSLQSGFTKQEIMDAEFAYSKRYKKVKDTCLKSTVIK